MLMSSQDTTLLLYPVMSKCRYQVSAENLKRFNIYVISHHLKIYFTIENEKDNRRSFLDII